MKLRLKAGVLSFTIYVSIVVSIMLLTIILYGYYTKTENAMYNVGMRLLDNLTSAEQWSLGSGHTITYGREEIWDLYGDEIDSVSVTRFPWGIFDGYKAKAFFQRHEQSSYFIVGNRLKEEGRSSVYLIDDGRPLSVVGETRIEGTSYLPLAGIQSAFINRMGYTGTELTYGEIKKSKNKMPALESYETFEEFDDYISSVNYRSDVDLATNVFQSFRTDTLLKIEVGDITLSDTLQGYVYIESSGTVTFDTTAFTSDIIVTAHQIEFKSGFTGQGQFFASDTIRVHDGATINYPSVLSVQNKLKTAYIEILENAEVNGIVLLDGSTYNDRSRVIKIEDNANFSGLIYCNGYLEGFGKVNGHVAVKRFLINSFSGVYENYIMNAEYKNTLDSGYLVPNTWFMSEQRGIVQWLD